MAKKGALEGIRVMDFGTWWAIPYLGVLLANMGAEVILIESPHYVTNPRGLINPPMSMSDSYPGGFMGPHPPNRAVIYNGCQFGKPSVTFPLNHPRGREVFFRLLKISDVVAENYHVGVMEKFGLTYKAMKEVKPDIIYVSAPAFGRGGPESGYAGFGALQWAASGMGYMSGYPGGGPIEAPIDYGDPMAGIQMAGTVLAALLYRNRTGKGQFIDVSQTETSVNLIGEVILDYTMNGRLPERRGNRHPYYAPHGVYRCRDEEMWVYIIVRTDEEWKRLCTAMGRHDLAKDERFSEVMGRWNDRHEIDKVIQDWVGSRIRYEAMYSLAKAGVVSSIPAGMVSAHPNPPKVMVPCGNYRCRPLDRWIAVSVTSQQEWQALCNAMGQPDLAMDERFADSLSRWKNQGELDKIIEEWTSQQYMYNAMTILQKAGVPAGGTLTMADYLTDPQYRARGVYRWLPHDQMPTYQLGRQGCLMSKTHVGPDSASSIVGQHNDWFYGELLGMSKEEIAELEREQIITREFLPGADAMPVPAKK